MIVVTFITNLLFKWGVPQGIAKYVAWGAILLFAIIFIGAIILGAQSCYTSYQVNKTHESLIEGREKQVNANVNKEAATIEVERTKKDAEKIAKEVAELEKKVEDARKEPAKQADAWAELDRFCSQNKTQPLCKDVRNR